MKIILIGKSHGYAVQRLREEARENGMDFLAVPVSSVVCNVHNNIVSLFDETNTSLLDGDCYIFRGIGDADQEVMVMAKYLLGQGATVIEEIAADGALFMDKFFLRAIGHEVPTLDYYLIQNEAVLLKIEPGLTYPVVIKATIGSMGKGVVLVKNKEELMDAYGRLGPRVILQQYVPVQEDFRAIVIGGKYIGAYSRQRSDGDFRMNIPGNIKKNVTLPIEAMEICERAARHQRIAVAGVDLVCHEGNWYVLEINASPQFKQFEAITGHNIAGAIIRYAVSRTSSMV